MGFASPIFNIIYINTLDTYVGMVYLIAAGIDALLLILLAYIFFFLRKVESKDKIDIVSVTESKNTL